MVFDVNAMTLAQLTTPADLLGRMSATLGFVTQGAKPLGALLEESWESCWDCTARCGWRAPAAR